MTSKYYGVVVSAHILAYTPKSVVQLLNDTGKPFFIDPMAFVFARDPEAISRNKKIRKSYAKLAAEYGEPFLSCDSSNRLAPSQFKDSNGRLDDSLIATVCERLLNFQRNKCIIDTSFPKYYQLLERGTLPSSVSPSFLVAPYFFAKSRGDDWYLISLKFAKKAKALKRGEKVYPVVCISREILWDEIEISKIVKDYEDFDGYLIWIDSVDEQNISGNQLRGLKSLVSKLASRMKPVYSLYGGYVFDLLRKFGLSGYSSGICYGESRGVDTKGGGAGNRYYVPQTHLKISEDLANVFFAESTKNRGMMCSCDTCSKVRSGIPSSLSPSVYASSFFEKMDFLDYRRHFVNVKFEESRNLEIMAKNKIIAWLDADIAALSTIDPFRGQPAELTPGHLRNWLELFR